MKGYRGKHTNPKTGKRQIVFNKKSGYVDQPQEVPCGQCTGCRLERSRQWAVRCLHEASLHDDNSFITLTYSPEHLPEHGTLVKKHFQDFIKRYRKSIHPKKIRYYHCGEYGEKLSRPHYHALIFGHDFQDKIKIREAGPKSLHTSQKLNDLWGKGNVIIGAVTFDSAAYVARYIMKKITGQNAEEHYKRVNPDTGEIVNLEPEYTTMSRRPGIGHNWYQKYKDEVYPDDFVIINGRKARPPKYYEQQLEKEDQTLFDKHRSALKRKAMKQKENNTPERLAVREKVAKAKLTQKTRKMEN